MFELLLTEWNNSDFVVTTIEVKIQGGRDGCMKPFRVETWRSLSLTRCEAYLCFAAFFVLISRPLNLRASILS